MSHRVRWWIVAVAGAGVAAAEWLREPAVLWVVLAWGTGIAAIVGLRPLQGWRRRTLVVLLAGLAIVLAVAQYRLTMIETRWSVVRAAQVDAAFQHLRGDLDDALHEVRAAAEAAARIPIADRTAALQRLAAITRRIPAEVGVAVLDSSDTPLVWAGRHRLAPRVAGDSVAIRATGYYVTLEARRHSADGRVAVASLLLWAHPAVPDRSRSLAERFRNRHDVSLVMFPGGAAPDTAEVFQYVEPTLSVQPVPSAQSTAKELAFTRASRAVVWLVLLIVAVALTLAQRPTEWYVLIPPLLWLALRAPIGSALGLRQLFSPATFFRPLLGPLSSSAGALAGASMVLTMVGVALWRRRLRRTWYTLALGAGLLYVAPYLIRMLGRGITPPVQGVSIGLWVTWQLALAISVAALVVTAAALFRGDDRTPPTAGRSILGAAITIAAAVIGVLVWSPRGAWPDWYPFLWTLALVLVAMPAPRWAAIGGIAIAAGSSAALVTWGAELSGKLQVAQRDIARLGNAPDPFAAQLLDRFGEQLRRTGAPDGASAMYARWKGSTLSEQGYPTHLALWSSDGELHDELVLDSLDVPPSLLSTLVREFPSGKAQEVVALARVPGVHYVLFARVGRDSVVTVSVGPRSALIAPGRLGRLLDPSRRAVPFYRLTLAPPMGKVVEAAGVQWRREGWRLRAEHLLTLPEGSRVVHAVLDLRGPLPLFLRAALVLLIDVVFLALLWSVAEYVAGGPIPKFRWGSVRRSFRLRLAATLAGFFILPAIGFTIWGLARLNDEAQRSRDLLISQTLREAAGAGSSLVRGSPASRPQRLRELSRRIDADFALYEGGRLTGASVEVLQDLGLLGPLLDPAAYDVLSLGGELETTLDGTIPRLAERVGYRVVEPGVPREAVLATPQLADDPSRGLRELDLTLGLLLVSVVGAAAALAGARLASRALSRPVAELRRSALALGKGDPIPLRGERPPAEFEPVFAAFERMATDIQASHRAQRVLAWGEMARQVAHEIKNPLTPLRLGVQHLRRVHRDRRPDFDRTLEETVARILAEIDRLDTIARAFSRFGAPADRRQPVDNLDLAAVAGEVVQLYRLTEDGDCEVRLIGGGDARGAARSDELKEVIVNLLENARTAGARVVTVAVEPQIIRVTDDGRGIPPELLPRIFEPRFSTTTSGSGLGLAIVRRLVEDWGGRVDVESEVGRGTTVIVRLAA